MKTVKPANLLMKVTRSLATLSEIKTQAELQSIRDQLVNHFSAGYKLNYSDSYHIAKSLTKKEEDNEYAFENLKNILAKKYDLNNTNELNAFKLLDYVLLECTRDMELNKTFLGSEAELRRLKTEFETLSKKSAKLDAGLEVAKKTVDSQQTSAITVIGLFSAIIMSFFGGISFSGQALEALSKSSPIRLVFVLSLLGFVLFNLLFLILYIIGKLTERKICSKCSQSNHETQKVCTCQKQGFWCKMVRMYPYVLWTNFILVFLMVCMSAIWVSTLFFNRTVNSMCVIIISVSVFIIFSVSLIFICKKRKSQ